MDAPNLTVTEIVAALEWTEKRLQKAGERLKNLKVKNGSEFDSLHQYTHRLEIEMQSWQSAFDAKIPKHPGELEWEKHAIAEYRKLCGVRT